MFDCVCSPSPQYCAKCVSSHPDVLWPSTTGAAHWESAGTRSSANKCHTTWGALAILLARKWHHMMSWSDWFSCLFCFRFVPWCSTTRFSKAWISKERNLRKRLVGGDSCETEQSDRHPESHKCPHFAFDLSSLGFLRITSWDLKRFSTANRQELCLQV